MLLSVVIPVFNEAENVEPLVARIAAALDPADLDYELIFVNDGSTDATGPLLLDLAARDRRVRLLEFSRNFGHQTAITAGLDFASGDAVVVMDADLQDPPELLPEMVRLFRLGYQVVSAQRRDRPGDGVFKRGTAGLFYWVMRRFVDRRLTPEVGDFRLFGRPAVLAVRRFREQHRFMRGLVAWLGLKEVIVPFERQERRAGTTKYPLLKMLRFAWTAVSSFSALPLRLGAAAGFLTTLFGIGYLLYTLFVAFIEKTTVQGWTSLVCLQIIFSGTILMAVGLVGDYVARIYEEAKGRPLYVVGRTANVALDGAGPERGLVLRNAAAGSEAAHAQHGGA